MPEAGPHPHGCVDAVAARTEGPESWTAVIHRSLAEIPRARWDALVGPDAVVRSHAYLCAIEASAVANCRYYFPVVYDAAGEMLAHTCAYTVTTDLSQLLPRSMRRVVAIVRRLWPKFLCFRITECGAPMVAAHAITLRRDVPRVPLIRAIERAVADIARAENSALVVFRDFTDADRAPFAALSELDYNRVYNLPLARVHIRWPSYEAYLSSMRSRYRKDIRRRLQRAVTDGQRVRVQESFGEQAANWAAQARNIQEHASGFKREVPTRAYYEHMDRALGKASLLLVVERGGRGVAHGMVLLDGENATATYFGREPGPPRAEWFHLLNEAIRIGIERGCRYVHLGRGSYDAKSLAGADVEPLHVYCKCRYRIVNALMKYLPNVMQPSLRAPRRIFHDG